MCVRADRAARCCVCRQLYSVQPRVRGLGWRAWARLRYMVAAAAVTLLAFGLSGTRVAGPSFLHWPPPWLCPPVLEAHAGVLVSAEPEPQLQQLRIRHASAEVLTWLGDAQARRGRMWRCCCC